MINIEKRSGEKVNFDKNKIVEALSKAFNDTEVGNDKKLVADIANKIEQNMLCMAHTIKVETIQDMCEEYLMSSDRKDVARVFILYREERARLRGRKNDEYDKYDYLSSNFLSSYKHKEEPFPSELGKFVYYRTYSRPVLEENRRERWWETVARVVDFNIGLQVSSMQKSGIRVSDLELQKLREEAEKMYKMMYDLKLFPSGRTMWVGGTPSSYLYPLSNFNCSFLTIDSLKKFSEIFFVLMLGTGVGLSVERKYTNKLPKINSKIEVIHKDYTEIPKGRRKEYTEMRLKNPNMIELVIGDSKFGR